MVPSFSNPGFPLVHTHLTRLPAMDARLSAAIDSFEASMRAAIRDAIHAALDSTLIAIHKVMTPVLADIRSDLAQLHCDLALSVEGDSDPASLCSEEAASIEVGHQKPHNGDGNPLRIPSTIHDHSIPPLLSSSPMLRALANSTVKPYSNKSAASTILLPESKTMISTPQLLHKHSFSATTKIGPEVVLNFSIISATPEAKFPSLLTDYYGAYLKDKFGWVNWYLVGKFVKKNFCALKLFDEMSKRQNDNMFIQPLVHSIEVLYLDCLAIQLYSFDLNCYLGFEYGSTIALGRAFACSSGFSQKPMLGVFRSNLARTSTFESPTQTSHAAFGGSIIGSSMPIGDMCYCNGIQDKGGGSKFNKMQLKRAVARIKLLRNKGQVVVKQMRRDIALLLQFGKNATTRIRVEYVIREHNTLAANEFIELFYELVVSRLFIIAKQ
ncbi:hypothetical protein ACFX13_019305 [Malus domestica]